jgi:AcrR family transcriptional regulator
MTATRPLRADAHRNQERLLTAAKAAFAENGSDASIPDIARRAGVEVGTLYRHFPTRKALLEAALQEYFEVRRTEVEEVPESPAPAEALAAWLKELLVQANAFRGMAAPLAMALQEQGSDPSALSTAVLDGGARLLARAQESGAVRPDANFPDLVKLVGGIAWASGRAKEPDRVNRLLELVMDGLRRPEGRT